jgi:C-terminal processing protease CtpA/Prc
MPALRVALLPLLCCAVSIVAQEQTSAPAKTISSFDRGGSLTMLTHVKRDLKDNYYDRTFHGINIEALFDDAEQRIKAAESVSDTVGIIAEVLLRLNDSHTTFVPPDRKSRVTYGWRATMLGDAPYVTAVLPGSDAEKKGLAPGDRILFWNRYVPTRQNLWQIYYRYNFIRPQSMQRIVVRKPDGAERAIDVESKLERREMMDVDDLLREILKATIVTENREASAGDTFVWRYTSFGDPKEIERVMKKARTSKSLVIDLRGNPGGSVDTMRELASRLFDRDVRIAVETSRKADKPIMAKGRKDAFTGPVAILVDSDSASASEVMARLVQLEKRGVVIGDRTAGAVMTSAMFPHTIGIDRLVFFATTVTIGDVRMTDGGTLEHVGVTPDEIVLPTGADLAAKRDPALARAIAQLGGTITPEQAGRLYR